MAIKTPVLVHRCPTCKRYNEVVSVKFCCGNDLIDSAPNKEEILEWIIAKEEQSKKYKTKIIDVYRKRNKLERRVIYVRTDKYHMPDGIRRIVLERDDNKCTKCGSKEQLHVHHIVYRSNHGTDELENLTTVCDMCHLEIHKDDVFYNFMNAGINKL